MSSSFSTALSGLSANATAIDVVGNNLANLNTQGFKADTVTFQSLVTQSIGAGLGATQVGFGVGTPITLANFSQGALQSTGGPLDAAIQGDGFFVVSAAGTGNTEYTRGGNFQVNTDGQLTTASRRSGAGLDGDGRGFKHQSSDRQHHGTGGRAGSAGGDARTCRPA